MTIPLQKLLSSWHSLELLTVSSKSLPLQIPHLGIRGDNGQLYSSNDKYAVITLTLHTYALFVVFLLSKCSICLQILLCCSLFASQHLVLNDQIHLSTKVVMF